MIETFTTLFLAAAALASFMIPNISGIFARHLWPDYDFQNRFNFVLACVAAAPIVCVAVWGRKHLAAGRASERPRRAAGLAAAVIAGLLSGMLINIKHKQFPGSFALADYMPLMFPIVAAWLMICGYLIGWTGLALMQAAFQRRVKSADSAKGHIKAYLLVFGGSLAFCLLWMKWEFQIQRQYYQAASRMTPPEVIRQLYLDAAYTHDAFILKLITENPNCPADLRHKKNAPVSS